MRSLSRLPRGIYWKNFMWKQLLLSAVVLFIVGSAEALFAQDFGTQDPRYTTTPPEYTTTPPQYTTTPERYTTTPAEYTTTPPAYVPQADTVPDDDDIDFPGGGRDDDDFGFGDGLGDGFDDDSDLPIDVEDFVDDYAQNVLFFDEDESGEFVEEFESATIALGLDPATITVDTAEEILWLMSLGMI